MPVVTTMLPVDGEVVDFTSPRKRIRFRVDDDVFEVVPELAADAMLEFVDHYEELQLESTPMRERVRVLKHLLSLLLVPRSYERFAERTRVGAEQPIGLPKFMEIIPWIFEQHGMVPSEPDSSSSPGSGSPESGTSSAASAPDAASTSNGSPSPSS